ncbi:MAG: hypothetical protein AAGF07_02890 [Patescibacteria group bacterium]
MDKFESAFIDYLNKNFEVLRKVKGGHRIVYICEDQNNLCVVKALKGDTQYSKPFLSKHQDLGKQTFKYAHVTENTSLEIKFIGATINKLRFGSTDALVYIEPYHDFYEHSFIQTNFQKSVSFTFPDKLRDCSNKINPLLLKGLKLSLNKSASVNDLLVLLKEYNYIDLLNIFDNILEDNGLLNLVKEFTVACKKYVSSTNMFLDFQGDSNVQLVHNSGKILSTSLIVNNSATKHYLDINKYFEKTERYLSGGKSKGLSYMYSSILFSNFLAILCKTELVFDLNTNLKPYSNILTRLLQ